MIIKIFEDFVNRNWEISPNNSANWANLTIDKNGDYIFFHKSKQKLDVIDPTKYGSNPSRITGNNELRSMSKVGGMSMYYTDPNMGEAGTGKYTHVVKIDKSKVYDFNVDPNGYWSKAKKIIGKGNKSPNDQVAWVTKLACDDGWEMVLSLWMGNYTRAQTTKKLVPFDYSYTMGNIVEKSLGEKYVVNSDKGWEPFIPKNKFEEFVEYLSKLEIKKYRYGIYDKLYHLRNNYRNLSEIEIKDIISNSNIEESDRDKLISILDSSDGEWKSIR